MSTYEAGGLSADWLNGWLAAIGVTVLLDDVRLAWSDDAIPVARFGVPDGVDLDASLALALPTGSALAYNTIARSISETDHDFGRKVSLLAYRERASLERASATFELAASVTDLVSDLDDENLPHGAFDPPAPRGETLWSRAVACAERMPGQPALEGRVRASLSGAGQREQLNGLGFDCRRLPSGLQASGSGSKVHVDPVIELLCFAALLLFPTRGNGRTVRQRGWRDRATKRGAFTWAAWRPALDRWAIDAFLDGPSRSALAAATVARYQVIPHQPAGSSDTTRAYFSAPIP